MIKFNNDFYMADIVTIYNTDDKNMNLSLVCDIAQDNYNPEKNNMMVMQVKESSFTVYILDLELTDRFRFRTDDGDYLFNIMVDENQESFAMLFQKKLVEDYNLQEKIIKKD